jgi:hypothetical protein
MINSIMGLLTQEPPQEPSDDILLSRLARRIKNMALDSYENLVSVQNQGIDIVWNHPRFEPQQIIDALGTNAVKVFQYHGQLTNYITQLATAEGIQPFVKFPTKAFTINPTTGKITVLDEPYPIPAGFAPEVVTQPDPE